jgi:23S rRNA pseudouridine955/2504/2580 synthase
MTVDLKTGPNDCGRRLDRILRKSLPDHSLSLIHRLLRQGKVRLNGKRAAADERVTAEAVIRITVPDGAFHTQAVQKKDSPSLPPLPEILWRGSGIIVFNKPPGLASHGEASLDTRVKAWLAKTLPPSLSFQPGPLHRLDKPTSGIITFSETLAGARLFSKLLRERKIIKTYLAIVEGVITGEDVWQDTLTRDTVARTTRISDEAGAKNAQTVIKAIASNGGYTLIEARLITGRTHQIRVQAAGHGHPLAGDVKYGGRKISGMPSGFFLHAGEMAFNEQTDVFPPVITAPPPESFAVCISNLFGPLKIAHFSLFICITPISLALITASILLSTPSFW